jgi:hypothetical protein
MSDLTKKTPTELLVLINKTKDAHDSLKKEIIDNSYVIDELRKLENDINIKIGELTKLEEYYVLLVEEMDKK